MYHLAQRIDTLHMALHRVAANNTSDTDPAITPLEQAQRVA